MDNLIYYVCKSDLDLALVFHILMRNPALGVDLYGISELRHHLTEKQ